jgi:hypothetical protein
LRFGILTSIAGRDPGVEGGSLGHECILACS